MPTRPAKNKVKGHIINNLLTSDVWSLQENHKPKPCCIDLDIAQSIWQRHGLKFSSKDEMFEVNK